MCFSFSPHGEAKNFATFSHATSFTLKCPHRQVDSQFNKTVLVRHEMLLPASVLQTAGHVTSWNDLFCYIARLSLNKMSILIGWFLDTCPWSTSNVSQPGYNCPVVARNAVFVCFSVFVIWESKYITKFLMYICSLGKQLVFFSRESWHQDSRENKTNCFPRDHTWSV